MSNTTEAAQVRETIAALPKLPVVLAKSMLIAQSWKPTTTERAAIRARRDFYVSMDLPSEVWIRVRDHQGVEIGKLVY